MPIFSQDEVGVLLLAGLAAFLSWGNFSRQMIAIRPYRYRPSSRFPLYGSVVLSGVALFFVLTKWSSHDVRDSGPYIFFYFVLGMGWLGLDRVRCADDGGRDDQHRTRCGRRNSGGRILGCGGADARSGRGGEVGFPGGHEHGLSSARLAGPAPARDGHADRAATSSPTTGAGRLASVSVPIAGTTATVAYAYDSANGQLLDSVTDRAGNTTGYQYDARFLKTQETASNGAITQYVYDPLGRLAMQTDALGNATLWGYDQFDQVTQMVYPDSTQQTPRVATYTYDAFGKLLTQGGTGQYPVTYGYDAAGNRVSLTDGNNSQTQWGYDGLNRVTSKTYADGSAYHYTYDPAGNLASRVDALGRTTQYHYNAYNLVSQVVYPTNPAVSFQYDALGRRTQMTDGSGTTTWAWNSAGQNTGYSQSAVGQGISYGYDAENHRTQMVAAAVPSGGQPWTTQYGYDASGRLITLLDSRVSSTNPFTYAYQAGTNWIAGHSNADGSGTLNQYDVLGRLTRVTAANGSGAAINTYAYNYDAAGQRTQEASTIGTRNFGYDNLRQLTSAYRVDGAGNPQPNYNFGYAFDAIGNWTKETSGAGELDFTANHLNQYTALSGAGFAQPAIPQYDLDGNMTSDGQGKTYVYDEENRLVEVDAPNNATVAKTVNVYDGLSRRVEKRTYGSSGTLLTTTRYLYDGLLPIAEYDSGNNLITSYTRGLDLSGSMQGAGGIGGFLAMTNVSGNSYSYFTDGNGNVVDLTDAYGNSAAHYEYDPFGNVVAQSGSLQQNYQWSSKETDANTGLVYYGYRFYNPTLGRWSNRDPLEERGGLNLYSLATNHPVRAIDPFGLDEDDPWVEADCIHLGLRDGALLYLGLGLTVEIKAQVEWCTCCNTVTHEVKPTFLGSMKASISAECDLGIGLGGGIFFTGGDFEAAIKGPQITLSGEGFYQRECNGTEHGYGFDVSTEGFIGVETDTALEIGLYGSVGVKYKLELGLKDISAHGATAYADATITKEFEVNLGLGAAEIGGSHNLAPEQEHEDVMAHIHW